VVTHHTLKPVAVEGSNMPVPGYDPGDVDDMLEAHLTDQERAELLTDAERDAYERGEASLVDLLAQSEIADVLADQDLDERD
jgi:hypothetical protein